MSKRKWNSPEKHSEGPPKKKINCISLGKEKGNKEVLNYKIIIINQARVKKARLTIKNRSN
jgi:hypothetical protein